MKTSYKYLMLKYIFTLISLFLFIPFSFADNCEDGEYVLSAYYSPLPGQNFYATGSYASEVVLNGGGIITASGEYVKDIDYGFVAAPPCFDFGEVVHIQDLGYFKVLDRGGAIKGNRIDVWVGSGDTGLVTALNFGKQTKYLRSAANISDDELINSFANLNYNLKYSPNSGVFNPLEFMNDLKLGDEGYFVMIVQQLLSDLS